VPSGPPSGRFQGNQRPTPTAFGPDERSALAAFEALAVLVDSRDPGTSKHSARVAELARELALELDRGHQFAADLHLAGKLHDIGKVALPDSILRKRSELTEAEWRVVRRHPVIGANLLAHISSLAHLAPIVRGHHERYDGHGYPDGLGGEQIPLGARILAVADAFDAMISDRTYQRPISVPNARRRLRECAGSQFDPRVVVALDRRLGIEPVPDHRVGYGIF
jgi:HD-GYP domain-containing protein (c-di-GMP phosphodiesterase class II)